MSLKERGFVAEGFRTAHKQDVGRILSAEGVAQKGVNQHSENVHLQQGNSSRSRSQESANLRKGRRIVKEHSDKSSDVPTRSEGKTHELTRMPVKRAENNGSGWTRISSDDISKKCEYRETILSVEEQAERSNFSNCSSNNEMATTRDKPEEARRRVVSSERLESKFKRKEFGSDTTPLSE
ncbi:hypothetical protein B9Z55_028858 [Caenorhabditis nigoni]|uniref:Uncharacterized protein n=1 Tax=Caenorhabditis nigoni TaxID=1611254 RepID=A0A2G5S9U3_9PELO|nr:hypothetical protein B9Z55_028858 [Caenorhabditis nigoni]